MEVVYNIGQLDEVYLRGNSKVKYVRIIYFIFISKNKNTILHLVKLAEQQSF